MSYPVFLTAPSNVYWKELTGVLFLSILQLGKPEIADFKELYLWNPWFQGFQWFQLPKCITNLCIILYKQYFVNNTQTGSFIYLIFWLSKSFYIIWGWGKKTFRYSSIDRKNRVFSLKSLISRISRKCSNKDWIPALKSLISRIFFPRNPWFQGFLCIEFLIFKDVC